VYVIFLSFVKEKRKKETFGGYINKLGDQIKEIESVS